MKKVRANQTVMKIGTTITYIVIGNEYELYTEFITEKMFSGTCYVVLAEDGHIHGLDSDYFDEI